MVSYYSGKVVVISGGTSGIGAGLVDKLLLWGAKVACCARRLEGEIKERYQYNDCFLLVQADVSKKEACKAFVEKVVERFGRIDILINNAGMSMREEFVDVDVDVIEALMRVNFLGSVYLTKYALPYLLESKGIVVGITSVAGLKATPGRTGYAGSKFALHGFFESLRIELLKKGVSVVVVAPGFVASNIRFRALTNDGEGGQKSYMDENKMMRADVCANYVLRAIYKRKKISVLSLLGKTTAMLGKFFPTMTDRLVYGFYYNERGELIK